MSHPYMLERKGSVLVVVDIQDRLLYKINDWQTVLESSIRMIKYAQVLKVPVVVTEQYPKGLGKTNYQVADLFSPFEPMEKTVFSCFGAPGFGERLAELEAKTLVLIGIEAHICVQQTALDALARGFKVHVVADATGSRALFNKEIGLAKIRQAGGVITSSEIALYEWLERAGTKEFKDVLPLLK